MGAWGALAFIAAYALSLGLHVVQLLVTHESWSLGVLPWNLDARWSAAAAWGIILTYIVLNALFLQPYLGDAARYFRNAPANVGVRREIRRQAVDSLQALHTSGKYDRIVVVAHSLGTVVAYDMLRAYFARICRSLPVDETLLGPEFNAVDHLKFRYDEKHSDAEALRANARIIVRNLENAVAQTETAKQASAPGDDQGEKPKAWLVTDFVTLGSPLTHAHYLQCIGTTKGELEGDFKRRVNEREFPTCPPARIGSDGLLTFSNTSIGRRFHYGALFGLTRWTNLYFPLSQLAWGDAIGGPVAPVFGSGIFDVAVCTRKPDIADFFAHIKYWSTKYGRGAPHLIALGNALDLADLEKPNLRRNFDIGGQGTATQTRVT